MGLLGGDGSGCCCVRLATEHPEAPFHDLLCLSLFANFQDRHFQMGKLRLGEVRSLAQVHTLQAVGSVWLCSLDSNSHCHFLILSADRVGSEAA